ncbi:MAG: hypothetical protein AVDCRST_MAG89-3245, partial [uncultured Gemmatimonadetes bacterium]
VRHQEPEGLQVSSDAGPRPLSAYFL